MDKRLLRLKCITIGLFLLMSSSINAQSGFPAPCQEVKQVVIATDSIKEKILFDFIKQCIQEKEFSAAYDKGILHLYEYHNSKNNLCWSLFARIDDSYKNNPPARFSDFHGDIILVFDADSTGSLRPSSKDNAAINQCLEQIIGDRVFTRPPKKSRWTSDVYPHGKKRYEGTRRNLTGGGGIYVEFKPDKTYTISHMM